MKNELPSLEIIVDTIDDAVAAEQGGATQILVCSHFPSTGVTPSYGMIARIQEKVTIPIVMQIRPHMRSCIPTKEDIEVCIQDIQAARSLGIHDFMIGFIDQQNYPHCPAIQSILESCGPVRLHSHMIWEYAFDLDSCLKKLIDLQFYSIRTSGRRHTNTIFDTDATKIINKINEIKDIADDRITIFLTGGITASNLSNLVSQTRIFNLQIGRGVRSPNNSHSPVDPSKVAMVRSMQLKMFESYSDSLDDEN